MDLLVLFFLFAFALFPFICMVVLCQPERECRNALLGWIYLFLTFCCMIFYYDVYVAIGNYWWPVTAQHAEYMSLSEGWERTGEIWLSHNFTGLDGALVGIVVGLMITVVPAVRLLRLNRPSITAFTYTALNLGWFLLLILLFSWSTIFRLFLMTLLTLPILWLFQLRVHRQISW